MSADNRWSFPDLDTTIGWCEERHGQGIRCTVASLDEFARNRDHAAAAVRAAVAAVRTLAVSHPDCSVSLKPTALGVLFDREEYRRNLATVVNEARKNGISIEIDMEGRDLVDATLRSAGEVAMEYPVTIALQAYLDRTLDDCDFCISHGIRIRIVKGAYLGDTGDFAAIQQRLRMLISRIAGSGENFSIGTHDTEVLAWITGEAGIPRHQVELGFLKGLAEQTKLRLAADGWDVSEYVPFGQQGGTAYRNRRERYLQLLQEAGREPAP